jgi:ABC-type branched-subunit amino acid transport system ATPase component
MLGLATSLLLDPAVLLIDELSLGLAPVVVQQLLEVVEQLKSQGITMVIVEQSVNVALSIADRAVFMEKGRVRFEGPARELLDRDDLVRAVFLGGEGG